LRPATEKMPRSAWSVTGDGGAVLGENGGDRRMMRDISVGHHVAELL